ncbi:MAG: EamA family transporter [Anaerolineae bacterium]|nr:EamA family transporter [Anaerolineae bacterium]
MVALLFISPTFTVAGQLLVKIGTLQVGASPTELNTLPRFLLQSLTNMRVVLGLACAIIVALIWIVAVSRADISFAYPFMDLAIVLVLALSPSLFGEHVPTTPWIGVAIVCAGILVTSR